MNTKEILVKIKDAVVNNAMLPKDVPVQDIKEVLLAEYSVVYDEESEEYKRLLRYCEAFSDKDISTHSMVGFLDRMISYSIESSGHVSVREDELPTAIDMKSQYKMYYELAKSYKDKNINQYYLCIENAYYYCNDGVVKSELYELLEKLKLDDKVTVRPVSIVIVSYNCCYLMQKCIESIRDNCYRQSYEIVVVDNASSDGVTEWLEQQEDIKLIKSDINMGFPKGCNIGVLNSVKDNDIFFLNNDIRLTPNALFWLRMGLYDKEDIGATGAVCNYNGALQYKELFFTSVEDYSRYGLVNNIYRDNYFEETTILCGFAMLIKRQAWNKTAMMDEKLTPGYYDDDDLSMQIRQSGYRIGICHNSFIYHAGSQSFRHVPSEELIAIGNRNHSYVNKKWGFDSVNNCVGKIKDIIEPSDLPIVVLELNAHTGATYAHLRYICPNLSYIGYECNTAYVPLFVSGAPLSYISDYMNINYDSYKGICDYVIINNSDELSDEEKEKYSKLLSCCVKSDGRLIWNDNKPA